MKRLLLIFFIFPVSVSAQLYYDFESGLPGSWEQSRDSSWDVSGNEALCGNFSLWHRMDDTISREDRISFYYDSLLLDGNISWQFTLRHAYLPSSANKWAIFLLSDRNQHHMMPDGEARAAVLGVNFKGSDDMLKLWKTDHGNVSVIAGTGFNWEEKIGTAAALIRVDRTQGGEWSIYLGEGSGESNRICGNVQDATPGGTIVWKPIGEGKDTGYMSPGYFGIYYRYSSRQDRKLWIDDLFIRGTFIRDTISPYIKDLKLPDEYTIRVFYSEDLDMDHALSPQSYMVLPGEVNPALILPVNKNTVDLVFGKPFLNGIPQVLRVQGIADRKGNVSAMLEVPFTWYKPGPGDIIFNEIMYDPIPEIGLPGYEYIELYNRSGYQVEMGDWVLEIGNMNIEFPDFRFPANEYLLIGYRQTEDMYSKAANYLDILTDRTILSNEGSVVLLLDHDSTVIDWMEYSAELHSAEYYAEGGWSLERIDPDRICHGEDNWTSSADRSGGTPGMVNSVHGTNPDRDPPEVRHLLVQDPHRLVIKFSEAMDRNTVLQEQAWQVDGGMGTPDSLNLQLPLNRNLALRYEKEFIHGKEYYLEPDPSIKDCSGNTLRSATRIRFALPAMPETSEILLSEILFNPLPYCPDFIELHNPGIKTYDLSDLRLANRDPENGEISSVERVINDCRLFFPEEYIVLTEDPEELERFYLVHDPASLVKVADMPKMGDIEGTVLVLNTYFDVLDEMSYHRDMHHPMLASEEGVSLERISFQTGSGSHSNWHSASSSEGFATPGRSNSQSQDVPMVSEGFEVEPEIFTPDMDGLNDILLIKYRFRSPGLRAKILVLDPRGRLVREIAVGTLLGTEGFYTWDGTDRQGRRARTGLYLVLVEVSGLEKGIKRYKKTCVLSTGH